MPLASQPRRRTDAPRAAPPWGTSLPVLSAHLSQPCRRKRFLGTLTGRDAGERDAATAATTALLRMKGASVFRVHNVAINRDALAIADAMIAAQRESGKGQAR